MSQLVLDDQLDVQKLVPRLERWITSVRLHDLRPGERILDDRVPELLLALKQPTFVTIDHGFWNRKLCHAGYCILVFGLAADEQDALPDLLRRVLRLPAFVTIKGRMGKVARVQKQVVTYWAAGKKRRVKWSDRD